MQQRGGGRKQTELCTRVLKVLFLAFKGERQKVLYKKETHFFNLKKELKIKEFLKKKQKHVNNSTISIFVFSSDPAYITMKYKFVYT